MQRAMILFFILTLLLTTGCSAEGIENYNEEVKHSDCPLGKDCEYPGDCWRYIDTNSNNICDHSE